MRTASAFEFVPEPPIWWVRKRYLAVHKRTGREVGRVASVSGWGRNDWHAFDMKARHVLPREGVTWPTREAAATALYDLTLERRSRPPFRMLDGGDAPYSEEQRA